MFLYSFSCWFFYVCVNVFVFCHSAAWLASHHHQGVAGEAAGVVGEAAPGSRAGSQQPLGLRKQPVEVETTLWSEGRFARSLSLCPVILRHSIVWWLSVLDRNLFLFLHLNDILIDLSLPLCSVEKNSQMILWRNFRSTLELIHVLNANFKFFLLVRSSRK